MSEATEKSVESLPPGYSLLNYTIIKVLGRGGFGITYLAHDNEANIEVVIKENMPSQFCTRDATTAQVVPREGKSMSDSYEWSLNSFTKEAMTLKMLQHPNIIRGIEFIRGGGTAYYVMHRVDGESLRAEVERRGGVDEKFLTDIAVKLLGALSYLHSKNVLHRDIKPANILVTAEEEPILIDFGAARELISEHTQTMVQSQGYTPIEQLQKKGNTGPWTDLYALGATLYEMVAEERPPYCTDRMGVDPYVPLARQEKLRARYSLAFLRGIDKALEVWPQSRWQSANEWKEALLHPTQEMQQEPTPGPPSPAMSPVPKQRSVGKCPKCGKNLTGKTVPYTCPLCSHSIRMKGNTLWEAFTYSCGKKLFTLCGRASRTEFAGHLVFSLLFSIALCYIYMPMGIMSVVFFTLSGIMVTIRRLHDMGKGSMRDIGLSIGLPIGLIFIIFCIVRSDPPSGSFMIELAILLLLVTVGVIIYTLIVLLCKTSVTGPNEYGPDVRNIE